MNTNELNEAMKKVASVISLSSSEQKTYISKLSALECTELSQALNMLNSYCEQRLGEEATLTISIKDRLEKEGWHIKGFSPRRESGPDIKASKEIDNIQRTIIIEVKGKPGPNVQNYSGQMRKYINDVIGDIINRMGDEVCETRYLVGLPDMYRSVLKERFSKMVRTKLDIYVLFLSDDIVKVLYPSSEQEVIVASFEEIFKK